MKAAQTLFVFLATATNVFAAPAPDANGIFATTPTPVPTQGSTPPQAEVNWVGDNTLIQKRAKGVAESCTVGKAECASGLGCFGCQGHKPVCQKGPGSNECCFRDDRGPICQIIPIGK